MATNHIPVYVVHRMVLPEWSNIPIDEVIAVFRQEEKAIELCKDHPGRYYDKFRPNTIYLDGSLKSECPYYDQYFTCPQTEASKFKNALDYFMSIAERPEKVRGTKTQSENVADKI